MSVYHIQTLDSECATAYKAVRVGSMIFLIVAILAILTVPFAASMVVWGKVLDTTSPTVGATGVSPVEHTGATSAATTEASQPATSMAAAVPATAPAEDPQLVKRANSWRTCLTNILAGAKVMGLTVAILIVMAMFLASNLSVISRCGGIGKFFGAFFWASLLLVMLVPWQSIMAGGFAAGVWTDLRQIVAAMDAMKGDSIGTKSYFYARFMFYPLVAGLVWAMVLVKFLSGYKAMAGTTEVQTSQPETPVPADINQPPTTPLPPSY